MAEEKTFKVGTGISITTAKELGFEMSGNFETPPAELDEYIQMTIDNIKTKMAQKVEANIQKAMKAALAPQAGEIVTLGYEYWDLLSISPIQFIGSPPYRPHKIIAGGELALHLALLFINPMNAPGGNPPATVALGSRGLRLRFESLDLTNCADGPDAQWIGNLPGPAPSIILFIWFMVHPNPGPNPKLIELNVTADITDPGQPYAAFATQWLDIEADPGFPIPQPPGFKYQTPMRFLVYPQ